MKKIGFLVVSYHTVNFFRPIIKKLLERGHEVQIYAIHPLPAGAREDKFDTHRIDWHLFDLQPLYDFGPDVLVAFNGYFKPIHAACKYLKERYQFLHAEVAWFPQRDYIYVDREIHDRSDVAKRVEEITRVFDPNLYKDKAHILGKVRQNYIPSTNKPPEVLEGKINIIVPLQLETDTSILYASPYFKDMESMVGFIDKCAKKYGPHLNIIVKKHPKWAKANFEGTFSKERYPNCTIISESKHTMNDYAAHCDGVIGINSTSLMEAMLHRTPVLQMGGNVYCTHSVFPKYIHFERFVSKLFHKDFDEDYFMASEIGMLTLIANQVAFRHPEDWVVDKIDGTLPPDYTRSPDDL